MTNKQAIKINEFVNNIDSEIVIKYSYNWCSDILGKVLYVGLDDRNIMNELMTYLHIDLGYTYYKHCLPTTWSLLHEIGHIMSGSSLTNIEQYVIDRDNIVNGNKSYYNKVKDYLTLKEETKANEWAYNYLINNKERVKAFEEI